MSANVSSTANEDEHLSPKQEQLITLLVSGVAIVTAAKNTGVAEKTAHRWLKLPHFQEAYKAAQKQLFDQALTTLMLEVDKAIDALKRNMDGELVPPAVQVRAAQIWLEQAVNMH